MEDKQSYRGGNKKSKRLTAKSKTEDVPTNNTIRLTSSDDNYPTDVRNAKIYWKNWSDYDRVLREVIDQGDRDTCWVHGTIRSLEAQLKIKFNLDITLSANHFFHGIEKKKSTAAVKNFEEIRNFLKINGIVQEKDCECEKRTDIKDPCRKNIEEKRVHVLKIDELVTIKKVNEEDLIELVKLRPVMVSLKATEEFKDHCGEGIYFGPKQSKKSEGDHVVLVTGYDSINGQHYWIIQNSWGVGWGDNGFAKIARKISREDQHSLFAEIIYLEVSSVDGLV